MEGGLCGWIPLADTRVGPGRGRAFRLSEGSEGREVVECAAGVETCECILRDCGGPHEKPHFEGVSGEKPLC